LPSGSEGKNPESGSTSRSRRPHRKIQIRPTLRLGRAKREPLSSHTVLPNAIKLPELALRYWLSGCLPQVPTTSRAQASLCPIFRGPQAAGRLSSGTFLPPGKQQTSACLSIIYSHQSESLPLRRELLDSLPAHRNTSVPRLAGVVNIARPVFLQLTIASCPYRQARSGF
jgi:hypothetical protein